MQVKLPEGWTYETHDDTIVISTPGPMPMSATVDFTRRGFRGGYLTTNGRFATETLYQGRGWKERLIADAVAYLQKSL